MITPEALARVLLPELTKAVDAGKYDDPAQITQGTLRTLCLGLIWLADGTYPPEWLSDEAVQSRKSHPTA